MKVSAILLAICLLVGCLSEAEDNRVVYDLTNQTRSAEGLPSLRYNIQMGVKADDVAAELAEAECDLVHSRLQDNAPDGWLKLGENLSMAATVEQAYDLFLGSPKHREAILNPNFNTIGVAAVWGNCRGFRVVYVVQEFAQLVYAN